MAHAHHQSYGQDAGVDNLRALRTAFFLNLSFTALEVDGDLWTNSIRWGDVLL